ncbi:protein PHYTOCHROME KINASE SUBSTRATE 4-like, partial [Trifolium medium]|nr:protein PHYTOCHROME KINASE SUBSTRATE 4-like [Trifolium medium]
MTMATMECYELSEASIEWSATTTDGYEESSIIGGLGGHRSGATAERWKRRGINGLLSCRCPSRSRGRTFPGHTETWSV